MRGIMPARSEPAVARMKHRVIRGVPRIALHFIRATTKFIGCLVHGMHPTGRGYRL